MPTPVIFVGAATHDAIAVVDHMPAPDERQVATDVRYAGGGPAATAAVTARRLGLEVALVAAIGEDEVGELIRANLAADGIAADHLQVEPDRASQATVVLCSEADGTRSIATRRAAALHLGPQNRELVRAAEWVHVDHLGWPAVAEALADLPLDRRPRISVDAGNPLVGEHAALCDQAEAAVYAPPMARLVERYGDLPHDELLRRVPARVVAATLGSGGSVGRDADGAVYRSAGFRVHGFGSSLGAGDVFHGALTAAIVRGQPLPAALTYANAVAALSCRGIDGRSAVPTHAEAVDHIRREHP